MEQLSAAVTPAMSIITGLIDVVNKIINDDGTVEKLNLAIIEAWKVLDTVVDSQLQGNNSSAFENQAKTLIRWCYDAEDILDTRKIVSPPRKRDVVVKYVKGIPHSLFNIDKNGKLLKELNEIVTQWKNILTQGTRQKTTTHHCDGTHGPYMSKPLIGREDDIEKLVRELLSCDSNNGTSIIGMCGLGKTSLAQTIFNNKEIVNQFSHRSWVGVTDGVFVWDNIKKVIDEDLRKYDSSAGNKHRKNLLIVFDNLLSVKHTEWHKFCFYKKELENKSIYVRIIVTTHNLRIPEKTVTTKYYLKPLPDVCCEEVIKENAKLYNIDLTDPSFLNAAKSMAKECEGLPLFAEWFGIVIAKRNDDQRVAIEKRRKLWHMPEFESEILPRLLPSYTNMKSEMRRCLAYFSLFPIDHQFNMDDLVHLFVGECFLQSYEATSNLKQIGEKCVHDLKERSILQPVPSTELSYKLQSFGQEFAKKAALGTCLHQLDQGELSLLSSSKYYIRHLSISWKEFNSESWSQLEKLRKLRTFLSLYAETCIGRLGEEVPSSLYKSMSCVRVLSLKRTDVKYLPKFIDRLKHLRYLDISYTSVTQLPETFPKLYALQFLKIKNTNLSHLPKKFYKLTNLRYIDWEEDDMRKLRMPRHIGKLFGLESLPLFDIGEKEGYSIGQLKDMKNLQGSICIENLQLVANAQESQKAMLHEKSYLRSIILKWKPRSIRDSARDEDILKGLQPHENVRELKIINYGGDNLPEWISNSMIEKVNLMECRSCYLPALAKMKNLKTLILEDIESITQVRCRSDNDADTVVCFPKLESLKFHNMRQLSEWTSGLNEEDMPHLRELKFFNCPNLNPRFLDDLSQRLSSMSIDLEA